MRRELGVLVSLVLIAGVFQTLSGGTFLGFETASSILQFSAELGLIALGVAILMIAGEFDLSVGSVFATGGMAYALLLTRFHWGPTLAGAASLVIAAVAGGMNAAVTLRTGIPSFIVTLGSMMVWRGLVLAVSGGWPVTVAEMTAASTTRGPWVWGLAAVAIGIVLTRTAVGNHLFAVGGSANAARACGVSVRRTKALAFVLAAVLAGFAGILQFERLGSLSPTAGEGLELDAIVAVVVGGAALSGGSGGIVGTVLGTLLVGSLSSGLVMVGAPTYWFRTFVGLILISSVGLNRFVQRFGVPR